MLFNDRALLTTRIHGYGGQGVKTIANILAKAAIEKGLFAQAFAEFGPERRGAPVKAFARFSQENIMTRAPAEEPDFAIIMDETLFQLEDTKEGIKRETFILINTPLLPEEAKKKFLLPTEQHRIHCIDSTSWLTEYGSKVHPSIPIIGKFIRITELIPIEAVKESLKKELIEKIGEKQIIIDQKYWKKATTRFNQ